MVMGKNEFKIDLNHSLTEIKAEIKVSAKLTYSEGYLNVDYDIQDTELRREIKQDNGSVWTDSCAEIFIGNGEYYINFELSASTALLVGKGSGRHNRVLFDSDKLALVKRSIKILEATEGKNHYILSMSIPLEVFGLNVKDNLSFNLYKCGDGLKEPHFLSAFEISNKVVDFHQPQFFAPLALS